MSNKLFFTAAFTIGGLLTGALAASLPGVLHPTAHASVSAPAPGGKPAAATNSAPLEKPSGRVIHLRPATTTTPGVAASNDSYATPRDGHDYTIWGIVLDNRDATVERGETTALSELTEYRAASTVWVKWKAPASGTASLDTYGSTAGLDTSLAVFTGSTLAKAKRIAWNDDSGTNGNLSHIVGMAFTKGVTYHIQVGSAVPSSITEPIPAARTGVLGLNFRAHFDEPANDDIRHATTMTGTSWTAHGFTGGSTIESGTENTFNSDMSANNRVTSIWYKWTAVAAGTMTVVEPENTGGAYQAIYSNDQFKEFRQIAYNNGTPGNSFANLPIAAGTTYYFQLGETAMDSGGAVTLGMIANYTGPVLKSLSATKGSHRGGNTITLTGTRLGDVSVIYWNSQTYDATKFTVLSSTKIRFTVPAGPKGKRFPVLLYTPTGVTTAVTSATHYTYS